MLDFSDSNHPHASHSAGHLASRVIAPALLEPRFTKIPFARFRIGLIFLLKLSHSSGISSGSLAVVVHCLSTIYIAVYNVCTSCLLIFERYLGFPRTQGICSQLPSSIRLTPDMCPDCADFAGARLGARNTAQEIKIALFSVLRGRVHTPVLARMFLI